MKAKAGKNSRQSGELPEPSIRESLLQELALRQAANPSFSVRAFARYLGIPNSTLKYLMDGSRQPSSSTLNHIAGRLKWPPEKVAKLRSSFRPKKIFRMNAAHHKNDVALVKDTATLAIYALTKIPEGDSDIGSMAKKLGISRKRAETAIDTLAAAGVLAREGKTWRPGENLPVVVGTSGEIRKYRETVYRHALKQLDVAKETQGGNLMFHLPLKEDEVPRVLKRINAFRRRLLLEFPAKPGSEVFYGVFSIFPFREIGR